MATAVVHVVDDDPHVRRAVSRLLRSHGFEVNSYSAPAEFQAGPPAAGPGCLVLDLSMPGMNGLELQKWLQTEQPNLAIVFISGQADILASVRAMKAGAVDFLTKPFEETQLIEAVASGLKKSNEMWERRLETERCWKAFSTLSPREKQVCLYVSRGFLNKQVGGELGIQEKTIKLYRGNVMRKLGVGSVADLVRLVETLKRAGRIPEMA